MHRSRRGITTGITAWLALMALVAAPGCSIQKLAVNSLGDALAESTEAYAEDDDPDLVRDALPFALKTLEGLLLQVPENRGLLLAACSGFTQYSFAFVEVEADLIEPVDYREAARLEERALRLYVRARDYGLRSLELAFQGITDRLKREPEVAVEVVPAEEVPLLYWTGAAWGAAISVGKDRPDLVADLPAVVAMMRRALALDEAFGEGAIHELMVILESLPANMGGSPERAREHFDRALELSGGRRASTYVTWAVNVSVVNQDREEFETMLGKALAIDPDADPPSRLENLVVQKRARLLLDQIDEYFL